MPKPFAMIIEDDRDTVALFRHILDFAGYKTEIILRGEKALERLKVATPDIILLDLSLPGVSGTEILDIIKQDERLAEIPVIVVTAHSHMAVGLQSQSDLVLLKPVSVDQLTNLILRLKPVDNNLPVDPPKDELTGLYSRSFFLSRIGYSIERIRQLEGGSFGVLFVDIDNFSHLWADHGKEFGDKVLVETAKFFGSIIRPIDTIARSDHDHFLVSIEDLSSPKVLTLIAERIHEKLPEYLKKIFDLDITVSIGMVHCENTYLWAEDTIKDADIALNFAKQVKPSGTVLYEAEKHNLYRDMDRYAQIRRIGLAPGDPTKPRISN